MLRSLREATPIRQITRAYSSLLSLAGSVQEINTEIKSIGSSMQNSWALSQKPVDIYNRLGFQFILDRSSLVDYAVIAHGAWEGGQIEFFTSLLEYFRGKKNNVFLDIGSYWGLYSFLFLRTKIFARIYAFESDAHNFAQLQANIFLNRASHEIIALNKAVSAEDGVVHVWDSLAHPEGNRGGVGVAYEDSGLPTHEADAISLDSYLPLSGMNVAIKMDIERHEEHALRGMAKIIRDNNIIIQIESFELQRVRVLPLLEEMGLRQIRQISDDFYYTNIPKDALGH